MKIFECTFLCLLTIGTSTSCAGGEVVKNQEKQKTSFYNMGLQFGTDIANDAWNNVGKKCSKWNFYNSTLKDSIKDVSGPDYKDKPDDFKNGYLFSLSNALEKRASECFVKTKKVSKEEPLPEKVSKEEPLPEKVSKEEPLTEKVSKEESSFYRVGYNNGHDTVLSFWMDFQEKPNSVKETKKSVEEMLNAQRQSAKEEIQNGGDSQSINDQLRGIIAGMKKALYEIESKCNCSMDIVKSALE